MLRPYVKRPETVMAVEWRPGVELPLGFVVRTYDQNVGIGESSAVVQRHEISCDANTRRVECINIGDFVVFPNHEPWFLAAPSFFKQNYMRDE